MKFLIFDAGPLISLSLSGNICILEKILEKNKDILFILTPQVRKEVVDRALTIKKYKLEAVKVLNLLEKKILRNAEDFVDRETLNKETLEIVNKSGKILNFGSGKVVLIQEGEASCLAFSKLCGKENLIVIDERTTRLITESPDNLRQLMEKKIHIPAKLNNKDLNYFKDFRYIRSSELVFYAFKNKMIDLKNDLDSLDALLYNLKYKGAAISSKEIQDLENLSGLGE